MYAVIETGGKQYKVAVGDVVYIEKLDAEENAEVTFDTVLMTADGDQVTVGTPNIEGATVAAKVLKNGKAKKVVVFKMKRKKNERKKRGHRQPYTKVEITSINA